MSIKVGTYPSGSGVAMPPANPGKSIIWRGQQPSPQ